MISGSLSGGLGNQLFQIFTTIACSIKLCHKCVFLYEDFTRGCTVRPTYWNTFLKPIKYMATFPLPSRPTIIREKHFHCEEIDFTHIRENEHVNLVGYFQSYKYFDEYRETLFKLIRLEETRAKVLKMYSCLNVGGEKYEQFDQLISMHFRIGDFIKYPDMHPILSYDYYYNSLLFIQKTGAPNSNTNVLFFCENDNLEQVNTCIARLQKEFPETGFQRAPEMLEDWQQLILMSCCRYNIIANSTFSWFGAYFNVFQNKVVCYPSLWFGKRLSPSHSTKDLFPPLWNKIAADNTICC